MTLCLSVGVLVVNNDHQGCCVAEKMIYHFNKYILHTFQKRSYLAQTSQLHSPPSFDWRWHISLLVCTVCTDRKDGRGKFRCRYGKSSQNKISRLWTRTYGPTLMQWRYLLHTGLCLFLNLSNVKSWNKVNDVIHFISYSYFIFMFSYLKYLGTSKGLY